MIRKLTADDKESVLTYLNQEPALNIFIIGDIEAFGFDQAFQVIYGEFDAFGDYLSVLLFYYGNSVYYSHQDRFNGQFVDYIRERNIKVISGKENLMLKIAAHLTEFRKEPMYFLEAEESSHLDFNEEITILHSNQDFIELYECLKQIPEFEIGKQNQVEFVTEHMNSQKANTSTVYAIKKDGNIVSTVTATAETSTSAMVIAVATIKAYRNMGLATDLMKRLMHDYITVKRKTLALFFDNPSAGKIYKNLGFKETNRWMILKKE